MKVPWLKAGFWGFVIGAVVISAVGFIWGGWTTSGTVERVANERAVSAVTAALTPICVASLTKQADAAKQLVALQKLESYERREAVEKGGWATMPGNKEPTPGVADSCAVALLKTKPKT